ncbi:hypothetical protein pipiens_016187, partial [Culex pipiens pipiens]
NLVAVAVTVPPR